MQIKQNMKTGLMRNVNKLQQPRTSHIEECNKANARGILLRSIIQLEGKRKDP
jgi:hypothetical protein